jgi:hypothetical protein
MDSGPLMYFLSNEKEYSSYIATNILVSHSSFLPPLNAKKGALRCKCSNEAVLSLKRSNGLPDSCLVNFFGLHFTIVAESGSFLSRAVLECARVRASIESRHALCNPWFLFSDNYYIRTKGRVPAPPNTQTKLVPAPLVVRPIG